MQLFNRNKRRRIALVAFALLAGCSYDDTPMALKVIDGETDRLIYARILIDASTAPTDTTLTRGQLDAIESAYDQSQHAYSEILRCHDDGVCRMSSMQAVCTDVAALLAARRALAPRSDLIAISEMLSENKGPMTAERLRLLTAAAERDGGLSELEESVLTLAAAAAAAHSVWSLTPAGEKERLARRRTHAVDEFKQRCDAAAL
jgi:hypothetical protein